MTWQDALRATLAAGPAPAPSQTPAERKRRLGLAEWHLREAVYQEAANALDAADYHREAAREFLELATGRKIPARDADALRFELQKELDQ